MAESFNITGAARIGIWQVSSGLANLSVSKYSLNIKALIIANYSFRPENIVSIEPYTFLLLKGIKIIHNVPKYKKNVIFFSNQDPYLLIHQIKQTGFLSG